MTPGRLTTAGRFIPDLTEANLWLNEYRTALDNVVHAFTNDNVDRNTVFRWTSAMAEAAELLRQDQRAKHGAGRPRRTGP